MRRRKAFKCSMDIDKTRAACHVAEEQAKNEDEGATEVEEEAAASGAGAGAAASEGLFSLVGGAMCAAITPDSVTEESGTLAASPAPLGAGAEAGGRAEVGTREAQCKRKHSAISQ